jgi:hypothetical protein
MKYFIISMYVLWIGLSIILAIKETYYENNINHN